MSWYDVLEKIIEKEEVKIVEKRIGDLDNFDREKFRRNVEIVSRLGSYGFDSEWAKAVVKLLALYAISDNKDFVKSLLLTNLPEFRDFFEKVFNGGKIEYNGGYIFLDKVVEGLKKSCNGGYLPNLQPIIFYLKLNYREEDLRKLSEICNKILSDDFNNLKIRVKEIKVEDPIESLEEEVRKPLAFLREIYKICKSKKIDKTKVIEILESYGYIWNKIGRYIRKLSENRKVNSNHWYYRRFKFGKEYSGNPKGAILSMEENDLRVLLDYILHFSYTWGVWRKRKIKLREFICQLSPREVLDS